MSPAPVRAVRFDAYGDRDVLQVIEVPMPVPAAGEVLVEVRAAGINPGEAAIRSGAMHEIFPATFPSGQGSDLAGVVTEVGDGVTEFSPGDGVLGFSWQRSSQATHVVVPVSQLILKPAALSWEVAGSLYVVGCTAWAAVEAVAPKPGETVAVSAAAGGVGTVVVQLLAVRGAKVLGIASPANADWLTAHGATPVPYGDHLAEALTASAPAGIDAFIDLFAPEYVQLAVDLGIPATASKRSSPSRRPRNSARRARAARTPRPARSSRRSPTSSPPGASRFPSRPPIHWTRSATRSRSWSGVIRGGRSC